MTTTNRPSNGGLARRRWLRDREAERELLALLDAAENLDPPATGASREALHAERRPPADQAVAGRALFPVESTNR